MIESNKDISKDKVLVSKRDDCKIQCKKEVNDVINVIIGRKCDMDSKVILKEKEYKGMVSGNKVQQGSRWS